MGINTIYSYFHDALLNNQFAQGGFAIAILSGLFLFLKQCFFSFKVWILRKTTMRIEIFGEDKTYNCVQAWLANSKFGKKSQALMSRDNGNGVCDLIPGVGKHFFLYKWRLFCLENSMEAVQGIASYRRSTVLQIMPASRKLGEQFINEAKTCYAERNKASVQIFSMDPWGNNWSEVKKVSKRPLDSVILDNKVKQDIMSDISDFKSDKERYNRLNVPWRRGYILYGAPGNGKTSLALAIASEFEYAVYALSLSCVGNDEKLKILCSELPDNSVLLLEDIDCVVNSINSRDKDDDLEHNKGITLSGLLNALDGLTSTEGRILIMTTNYPEKLDPALIRPGRIDRKFEIGSPNQQQVADFFNRFYFDQQAAETFSKTVNYDGLSMAKLQVFLLSYKTAKQALENCHAIN